jgi:LPXTG-motif cell wall-anchored protein
MAIGLVLLGIAVAPGVASAHFPLVSGTTQCRVDSWSVTWTARADETRDLDWQITSPGGYSPAGSQSDTLPFTRTATYLASQTSATESVEALWSDGSTGEESATVQRPPLCPVDTTPTTTTTRPPCVDCTPGTVAVPTTTTTQPPCVDCTPGTVAVSDPTTTTTVEQAGPTTTVVGQQGPTSSVDQSSGAATTQPVGGALPATGNSSTSLVVIALTMIGIGAVMLRLTSRSTR